MSEPVWVSDALMDREILLLYTTEVILNMYKDPPNSNRELSKAVDLLDSAYKKGERIVDSELLSEEITLERPTGNDEPPPPFFRGDYAYISREVRALLEEFELGETAFKDVTLVNPFAKTRHEGYSILNVCEVRNAVDVEQSEGLRARPVPNTYNFTPTKNDQIVVRQSDVGSADLWMDLTLRGAYFISDRLHSALKEAALFQRPRFLRCKMV